MSMGGQAEGLPCTDPVHNVVTAENKVNSKFRTRGGGGHSWGKYYIDLFHIWNSLEGSFLWVDR